MSSSQSEYASGVIRGPRERREFPHPEELYGLSPIEHPRLFAAVPWLLPGSYRDRRLIDEHVMADVLPDGLPLGAIECDDWIRRCVVPDHALIRSRSAWGGTRRASIGEARTAYTKLVYQRLHRFPGDTVVPPELGFEAVYGPALADALVLTDECRREMTPKQEALAFRRSLLRAEFRFMRRRDDAEFVEMLRWGRRVRSRFGYLVPYQMREVQNLDAVAR